MGLGMGGTMMPIMTAALRDADRPRVARGSTLMNIIQQVGGLDRHRAVVGDPHQRAQGQRHGPARPRRRRSAEAGDQLALAALARAVRALDRAARRAARAGLVDMADAFATVFIVATILVACCLIPAAFLPRKKVGSRSTRPR